MTYPLVSTQWLQDHLNDPDLVVLDVRGNILPASEPLPHYFSHHDAYRESHIPGAQFVDWIRDITIDGPAQMQIAPPEKFAALMNRLGIGDGVMVVAYDDLGGIFAARMWWALLYYGHDQAAVLNGGWKAWEAEGRPVTDVTPVEERREPFVPHPNPDVRRTREQVLDSLGGNTLLVDVRSPAEYSGQLSRAKRKGRIPGAVSLPAKENLNGPDGLLPNPDTLRATFAAAGVTSDNQDVVTYCNSGVSSAYGLLAYRAAGFTGGAVYDGSWKDWANDEAMPIEGA
jgi:thiosulfate/3-mercaptopyruvate sulfurtransferase